MHSEDSMKEFRGDRLVSARVEEVVELVMSTNQQHAQDQTHNAFLVSTRSKSTPQQQQQQQMIPIHHHGLWRSCSFGSKSLDQFCNNCGRDVRVEMEVYVTADGIFCGQNCFWSMKLDCSDQRLKVKKRGGRVTSTAAKKKSEVAVGAGGSMQAVGSMAEYSNAIFQYQVGLHTPRMTKAS